MAGQPVDEVGIIPDEPVAPEGAWCNPNARPYPRGAPLVTSAPPDDSPLAYNEDEIVALWSQIYRMFIKIRHFKEWEVIFPPKDTGRHPNIDRARFRDEFGMSDRVISLIERLPYTVKDTGGYWGQIFFPDGRIFDYLHGRHDGGLGECREPYPALKGPGNDAYPPDRLLLPDDVALLSPADWQGLTWILDTKTNAIRVLESMAEWNSRVVPEDFLEERPGDEWYYRNWPAFHAPFILKKYIRDLWTLRFVPMEGDTITPTELSIEDALIARALKTRYGWPDAFRADAWEESIQAVRDSAVAWEKRLLENEPGGKLALLERWKDHPEDVPDIFEDSDPGSSP